MKTKLLITTLIFSAFIISCSKEKEEEKITITAEEAAINTQLDIMNDDLSKIVEDNLTEEDGIKSKSSFINSSKYTPVCAIITRVPEYGTTISAGTTITKTIDFGTGCNLENGNTVKGKLVISFIFDPDATSKTINYSFEKFYHNAVQLNGNKTFTRVMGKSAANANNHPIVTMNLDITATFPNGNVHTRVGQRVREITSGYDTAILSDNVYQVTGSWTTTFPNAAIKKSTIVSPLIIKLNCPNIVQGIISFERNNKTATLDYGIGTCDKLATFTINGKIFNINLR
jgi:hypothetical protein